MVLEQNVGGTDRKVRGLLGLALAILALLALRRGSRSTGLLAGVGAAGMLFNYATQFCGLNAALGIDTCEQAEA